MKIIYRIFLLLFVLVSLLGCEQQPLSHQKLMKLPEKVLLDHKKCHDYQSQGIKNRSTEKYCTAVAKAYEEINLYLNLIQSNQKAFGKRVIDLQIQINILKKKIATMKKPNKEMQMKLEYLNDLLSQYYAIINMVGRPQ